MWHISVTCVNYRLLTSCELFPSELLDSLASEELRQMLVDRHGVYSEHHTTLIEMRRL